MKKSIFCFFLLFIALFGLKSQPILTATNSNPVIGDVFEYHYYKPTDSFESTGVNHTWDLSTMISNFGYVTKYSTSALVSTFPSSSIQICDTVQNCIYYNYTNSFIELTGQDVPPSPPGPYWNYLNPIRYLNYPFQFGDSFTDSFLCEVYGWSSGLIGWESGSISNSADGYGTIILPNGTFNNVLRVKSIYTVIGKSISGTTTDSTVRVIYQWYKPNVHQPIGYVIRDNSISGTVDTLAYFLNFNPTSISDYTREKTNISISPNPTNDKIVIDLEKPIENLAFELRDFVGSAIPIEILRITSTKYEIIPYEKINGLMVLNVLKNDELISSGKILFRR